MKSDLGGYSDLTTTELEAPTVIMEDNQGAIAMARNPGSHARTKHIDIRFHYVREAVQQGAIALQYCPTDIMLADIPYGGKFPRDLIFAVFAVELQSANI